MPKGFLDSRPEKYGVDYTDVCRWHEMGRILNSIEQVEANSVRRHDPYSLIGEFVRFLEELNMTGELSSAKDFAKAGEFLQQKTRLENTFRIISQKMREAGIGNPKLQRRARSIEFTGHGVVGAGLISERMLQSLGEFGSRRSRKRGMHHSLLCRRKAMHLCCSTRMSNLQRLY